MKIKYTEHTKKYFLLYITNSKEYQITISISGDIKV